MDFVGADLAAGLDSELVDLGPVRVCELGPWLLLGYRCAGVAGFDVLGYGVVGAAGELGGSTKRSGLVVSCKDFHDFSVRLHRGAPFSTMG